MLIVNQTYLSVSEVNTEFGHVSMGRSFALDMGALVPNSDQRLGKCTWY
jgi:phosphatidylinositol 4-kinase